jgi:predicted dinucleotide-binding enzyme
MNKVRIVGAGSIGNHLAHCFINSDFEVEITDKDDNALNRMKNQIYPSRYNQWDDRIKIINSSNNSNYTSDVLVIGTPPNTHLEVALKQLELSTPKIILIEKPISHPDLFLLKSLHLSPSTLIKSWKGLLIFISSTNASAKVVLPEAGCPKNKIIIFIFCN